MIEKKDVLSLEFYKKAPFKGSVGNMRYMIAKLDPPEDAEGGKRQLKTTVWPGPYSFEATEESLMSYHLEEFSDEGLGLTVDYLNSRIDEFNS